jgi:CDGSH-type Zn-finger protein
VAPVSEPVEIKVRDDGPLKVSGPVRLVDPDGAEIPVPDGPFALCRCGLSQDKPFCDRSHRSGGFASCVRAAGRGAG